MSAHREVDLAPGTLLQLVGDLYPRRTGADHQYRTFGQLLRVVVVGRVDLPDTLVARRDRAGSPDAGTGRWRRPRG